nr:hypothetical protein [Rhizobium setariae]
MTTQNIPRYPGKPAKSIDFAMDILIKSMKLVAMAKRLTLAHPKEASNVQSVFATQEKDVAIKNAIPLANAGSVA